MTALQKQMLIERAQLYISTSAGPYADAGQIQLVAEIRAQLAQVELVSEQELGEAIRDDLAALNA